MVKVLVVDDSALMRKLIPQILERDSSIQVVGTAMDGHFALKKINELRPDVITLDLEMPRMDGIETLRQITKLHRIPVIIVSAHTTEGAVATFKGLTVGAFDFVAKPKDVLSEQMAEIAHELTTKIRVAAATRTVKSMPVCDAPTYVQKQNGERQAAHKVIAIGLSTGGPNALQYVLSKLPPDFPAALVVVQHMPEAFTNLFAKRLNESCALEVKEAESGDLLLAGRVLICPGNRHMKIRRKPLGNVAVLSDERAVNGHRPSVEVLFRSVAEEFGSEAAALLMTGMGEDGAEGLGMVQASGGLTLAQNEDTCVVYGMPRAAIKRGYAAKVLSLQAIPTALRACCQMEASKVNV